MSFVVKGLCCWCSQSETDNPRPQSLRDVEPQKQEIDSKHESDLEDCVSKDDDSPPVDDVEWKNDNASNSGKKSPQCLSRNSKLSENDPEADHLDTDSVCRAPPAGTAENHRKSSASEDTTPQVASPSEVQLEVRQKLSIQERNYLLRYPAKRPEHRRVTSLQPNSSSGNRKTRSTSCFNVAPPSGSGELEEGPAPCRASIMTTSSYHTAKSSLEDVSNYGGSLTSTDGTSLSDEDVVKMRQRENGSQSTERYHSCVEYIVLLTTKANSDTNDDVSLLQAAGGFACMSLLPDDTANLPPISEGGADSRTTTLKRTSSPDLSSTSTLVRDSVTSTASSRDELTDEDVNTPANGIGETRLTPGRNQAPNKSPDVYVSTGDHSTVIIQYATVPQVISVGSECSITSHGSDSVLSVGDRCTVGVDVTDQSEADNPEVFEVEESENTAVKAPS